MPARINPPLLKVRLFNSINEVPKDQWDELLKARSCTMSHKFWQLVEDANLNGFQYKHAFFLNEHDELVGLSSFYTVTNDIAIFSQDRLRNTLTFIRRLFPRFLRFRMLECGTPIIMNSPPYAVKSGVSDACLLYNLNALLRTIARQQSIWFILIRDFDVNAKSLETYLKMLGYHWLNILPNSEMDIKWGSIDEYRTSLKSYYRSKLVKHLKRNTQLGVHHDLIEDFGELAVELCQQWLVVHHHADECEREVLTPEFYRGISDVMGSRSMVLRFYRGDEWIGHALLLLDGDILRWLYFGRREAANDSLYFYCIHTVIETAISLGAQRLDLGMTTYPIKQDLGACLSSIHMAIYSPVFWIQPFISWGFRLMNKPATVRNKSVFKQSAP